MLSVERVERSGESVILYDASRLNHMREAWFDPASWPGAAAAAGRGATLFINCEGRDWVLRHYYRGGLVARFVDDGFPWLGERRVRSFREWRLLAFMAGAGLPAPRPVAARYRRRGLVYRADIITARIPGVAPLSVRMLAGSLARPAWHRVGACIARFHAARVCHADLNAHNVQLDATDDVYLLDFDRGRVMPGAGAWQARNLARLRRSLLKVSAGAAAVFGAAQWEALLEGYHAPIR